MIFIKKRWILSLAVLLLMSFFMPDTSASIDYRTIRVRISMSGTELKQMNIGLNGDYMLVQDPALSLPSGAYEIRVSEDGMNIVLKGNGIDQVIGPEIQFIRMKYSGTTMSTLRLENTVHGNRNYLGNMRFHLSGGSLVATNHVPMEEYLYGVVAYEMSNSWPLEALKAQAVSARGYAIKKLSTTKDYDIGDTATEQVYKGFEPSYTRVIQAVNETKGKVATYNNKIIDTYYAASNGGQTDWVSNVWGSNDASYPYLVMKDDPYDLRNPSSLVQTIFLPAQVVGSSHDAATGTKVVRVVNVTDSLNIRSGPGTSYPIIGKAYKDQLFSYVSTDPNGWHKIRFYSEGNLVDGYVSPDYTQLEDNQQNGYVYINPVLKDLQQRTHLKIGGTYSIADPSLIKINQVTRFENGTKRWPKTESRSYVTAIGDVTIQYKKGDGTLSEEIVVNDVSIQLMMPNGSGGYWLGHDYLNANLRMRGVEQAQSGGIDGYNVVNRRYGHGIGMSQRGAQQMANEGKTYEEILAFYFHGTALATYETTVPELPSRGESPTDPQTPVPTLGTQTYKLGANSITGVQENTAVSDFINGFAVQNGTLTLVNASNTEKTSGPVATGDVLHVKDGNGAIVKSYSILIYGDVNGDGMIDVFDITEIRRHIIGLKILKGVHYSAANSNLDQEIDVFDLTAIRRHILRIKAIDQ